MKHSAIHVGRRGSLTGLPGQIRDALHIYTMLADPNVSLGRKVLIVATAACRLYP